MMCFRFIYLVTSSVFHWKLPLQPALLLQSPSLPPTFGLKAGEDTLIPQLG